MEKVQFFAETSLPPAEQRPRVKERPLQDWSPPIQKRHGAQRLLSGISVWHDFDWCEVIGHNRTKFRNCKELAAIVRKECPKEKNPVLFLTGRSDITISVTHDTSHRVVIVNVNLVLNSGSASQLFVQIAQAARAPITELVANSDLLTAALQQDPEFRAKIKDALARTDDRDSRAKMADALALIEGIDDITDTELTDLVTLLQKLKETTEPLAEVLESLADVSDVVRWARVEPTRLKELREQLGPDPDAPAPTINQIAETLKTFPTIPSDETLEILKSINGCEAGIRRYVADNLPLLRELAQREYTESDLIAIKYRQDQLEVFRELLDDPEYFVSSKAAWKKRGPEAVWQHFFEKNPWIFGYGLQYIYLSALDDKKLELVTTGFQIDRCGKRADALMKTRGALSSLCFCEIKTHLTKLLVVKDPYRPGCWSISEELAGSYRTGPTDRCSILNAGETTHRKQGP